MFLFYIKTTQLLGEDTVDSHGPCKVHNARMNVDSHGQNEPQTRHMVSQVTRERIVNSCQQKLSRCRQDFESSLHALHQEADHLGPDHLCFRCYHGISPSSLSSLINGDAELEAQCFVESQNSSYGPVSHVFWDSAASDPFIVKQEYEPKCSNMLNVK